MLQFPHPDENILPHEIRIIYPRTGPSDDIISNRILGSLVGLAVGDALGASVEFRPQQYLAAHPIRDMMGGGTWGLQAGQWTDDTSMALCLASSLITQNGFNPYDQLVRYKWWYKYGYLSSTGKCFDIGHATRNSLEEFSRRQEHLREDLNLWTEDDVDRLSYKYINQIQFDVNCSKEDASGNGALMRLAPVPLFFYQSPLLAVEYSGRSARLTHGSTVAVDACRYYGALIVAAINGESKDDILSNQFCSTHRQWFHSRTLHPDINRVAQGSFKKRGGYKDGIRGKGHVVWALEAALWAFWSTDSFADGALNAVNLGDDTDTTAAIYGQLAGAYYGYDKIPCQWRAQLYANQLVVCIATWLEHLSPSEDKTLHPRRVVHSRSGSLQRLPEYRHDASSKRSRSASNKKSKKHTPEHRKKSGEKSGNAFSNLFGCASKARGTGYSSN